MLSSAKQKQPEGCLMAEWLVIYDFRIKIVCDK